MSNFFEQELRKLFGDGEVIRNPKFVGRVCVGELGGDLRVRAEFVTMGTADHYEALRLTVLNRTGGEVNVLTCRFGDVLGQYPPPSYPVNSPFMWTDCGVSEWYGFQPSAADYHALRQAAADYLDVFRERVPERTAAFPAWKPPGRAAKPKGRNAR